MYQATMNMPMDMEMGTMMNERREQLSWTDEMWDHMDRLVRYEEEMAGLASAFLPMIGPRHKALTVDSDLILTDQTELRIDEAATFPLIETWVEFALTPQQVEREAATMTACTLSGRAANILTQAQDLLIFQGDAAIKKNPLFTQTLVRQRSGPAGSGLFGAVPRNDPQRILIVKAPSRGRRYGEQTFRAVTEGIARLKGREHYGPYVLILHTIPYADTFAPLSTTLVTPAQRIESMMTAGFFETGTLPPLTGLLISIGGNSMDLIVGRETGVSFMQEDPDGKFRFRVWKRFALRIKDPTAILALYFK